MHPCGTARTGSLCPSIVYLINGSVSMNYSLFFSPTNIYSQVILKLSDTGIRSCETRKKHLENRLMRSKSPDGNKQTAQYYIWTLYFLFYCNNFPTDQVFEEKFKKVTPSKKNLQVSLFAPTRLKQTFLLQDLKGE